MCVDAHVIQSTLVKMPRMLVLILDCYYQICRRNFDRLTKSSLKRDSLFLWQCRLYGKRINLNDASNVFLRGVEKHTVVIYFNSTK